MTKSILAVAAFAAAAAVTTTASAGLVAFQADVTVTSGDLTGQQFSAYALGETNGLTGIGEEFASVERLNFPFGGVIYTEEDGLAELVYFDNEFLGLSYTVSVPDTLSFVPGFFSADEAFFAYDGIVLDGEGDVAYSPAPIPLPASGLILLTGLAALGLRARRA